MSRKRQTRPEQVPMKPGQPANPEPEPEESSPEVQVETPTTESPQEPVEQPAESPQPEGEPEAPPSAGEPAPPQPSEQPQPEPMPVSLSDILNAINDVRQLLQDQHELLLTFQSAKRRAPMLPNGGKVQVVDKQTGEVFLSKNGTYKTLLKRGALKELVDKGIFGTEPEKNSFGWYALKRAWPDRFEEQAVSTSEGQSGPAVAG